MFINFAGRIHNLNSIRRFTPAENYSMTKFSITLVYENYDNVMLPVEDFDDVNKFYKRWDALNDLLCIKEPIK